MLPVANYCLFRLPGMTKKASKTYARKNITTNMSSIFSCNSQAKASELKENIEDLFTDNYKCHNYT